MIRGQDTARKQEGQRRGQKMEQIGSGVNALGFGT